VQLKREIAGTSRIEGADFTEAELDVAIAPPDPESADEIFTRSQRQAAAAARTYDWIAALPTDYPVNEETIRHVHRLIVTGADDDHCPPGLTRSQDENVTFGYPRHRGVEGGEECSQAFSALCTALVGVMRGHDPIVQGLALHYHLACQHPFLDGNGRTARALEALMLQRVGLRDTLFIAMSNYYYEEKPTYLAKLSEVRAGHYDLTPFLVFALHGIEKQCRRLSEQIGRHLRKALFRNLMYDLFNRLRSPRKRVIVVRQIAILNLLLDADRDLDELFILTRPEYSALKNPNKAIVRDLNALLALGAITYTEAESGYFFGVNLDWPTEITETEFFRRIKAMPTAKTHSFLDRR
jgi:cell filamentation protein, protein adenylyltransferase